MNTQIEITNIELVGGTNIASDLFIIESAGILNVSEDGYGIFTYKRGNSG